MGGVAETCCYSGFGLSSWAFPQSYACELNFQVILTSPLVSSFGTRDLGDLAKQSFGECVLSDVVLHPEYTQPVTWCSELLHAQV